LTRLNNELTTFPAGRDALPTAPQAHEKC
jgi:hypothetical protein